MENDARWIYNDVQRGFDEAKRTGKPLLVVLRCIPCMACMGLDASVLTEAELLPVLDKFVCVRVINANAAVLVNLRSACSPCREQSSFDDNSCSYWIRTLDTLAS